MRSTLFAAVFLAAVSTAQAQEAVQKETPRTAESCTTADANSAAVATSEAAAPAAWQDPNMIPGHPLDPHDVDVLTGKADRETGMQYGQPNVSVDAYGAAGYGRGYGWRRGGSIFRGSFRPGFFAGANGRGFLAGGRR